MRHSSSGLSLAITAVVKCWSCYLHGIVTEACRKKSVRRILVYLQLSNTQNVPIEECECSLCTGQWLSRMEPMSAVLWFPVLTLGRYSQLQCFAEAKQLRKPEKKTLVSAIWAPCSWLPVKQNWSFRLLYWSKEDEKNGFVGLGGRTRNTFNG